MLQYLKHVKWGTVSKEHHQGFKKAPRHVQTKLVNDMIYKDETGKWQIDLQHETYQENFKKFRIKQDKEADQGLLLEDAQTRAGGGENLRAAVAAGRVVLRLVLTTHMSLTHVTLLLRYYCSTTTTLLLLLLLVLPTPTTAALLLLLLLYYYSYCCCCCMC